jgi:integrase
MPRPAKPPRLYLRRRRGRAAQWVILDQGEEIGTGAGQNDRAKAEKALADHIAGRHRPVFGDGHPSKVLIADVLSEYAEKHGPSLRRADLVGIAITRIDEFFADRTVATIMPASCVDYVAWRGGHTNPRAKVNARPIKKATARRELVVLGAALAWCWKAGQLDRLVPVSLPPEAEPRERHLTQAEAVRLLAGALGFYETRWCDIATRRETRSWRRMPARINRHVARFVLLALYTGTRHDALLRLQWLPNVDGGWIDLDAQVLYRRPAGAIESAKRRPPLPLPPRLLPHLRRWRALTARFVIEWKGRPVLKERRAWNTARNLAGLGPDVTPHVLRHTSATWLLQRGVSVYDVAGVLGTTEAVIRRTYGHHAKDHLHQAVRAFSRRRTQ